MNNIAMTAAALAIAGVASVGGYMLAVGTMPAIGTAYAANGVDFEARCGGGVSAYEHAECQSFVAGVVAGLQISPHPHICFPEGFDRRQGLPIVMNWMRSHPEMLNWGPVHLVRQALRETYPCGNGVPAIGN
jgi:hypothetical protein